MAHLDPTLVVVVRNSYMMRDTATITNIATGFGSNSSGGGLFGANKPAGTSLFGSTNTSSNTGGGLFGSTNQTSTGFGASSGGFGASNNNTAFGNNSTNTTFSGFGSTANKPAFGSNTSGTTLFGQGGSGTTGGFGASSNTFGGSGTALGQNVPPSQGTAGVAFAPTTEKDNAGTINYQSISFMEPYNKYSPEELRLADYVGGRRYGNGAGQPAGAFGSSTFGGFGSNTSSGFGSNNTPANNPFGSNNSTSGGFGSNTNSTFGSGGGGLFGQNKPATSGGLFGQPSSGTAAGGLFGGNTSNNTSNNAGSSNPFGTSTSNTGFGSTSGGGGLFGNNNNQQKPGGLFGNTAASSTAAPFSFGSNNNQQSSTTNSGGLFGNNNQSSGGGLFGSNNTSTQQKPGGLFGNSASGGFGASNNAQPSGGLFGGGSNSSTGGGLFGNNNTTTNTTGGGLFGNNQPTNTGGGLFGGGASTTTQNKPGGLFGGSTFGNNQQSSTGGGLFGNNNTQPSTGGGGLFNNTASNTSGGFNFGNNNQNKPAGSSLFGGASTTNNQSGGMFSNSMNNSFGNSLNQSQQQPQGDIKHASLLDSNPYGQSSIWTGLPSPTEQNSKPLVTPLVAAQNLKDSQSKPPPNLRLNQSRYMTPPRRGYGFTYSTYGTPNSAASTPGGNSLSTSMYGSRFTGGSFGRSMAKSASISNMRSYYSEGESVLAPGAFTPSSSRYSSGSIRRLTIDRSIRDDLFNRPALPAPASNSKTASPAPKPVTNGNGPAPAAVEATPEAAGGKLKKRVSFDKDATGGQNGDLTAASGAIVRLESDEDATSPANGTIASPEPVRNNALAAVPEDRESEHVPAPKARKDKRDPQPGEYWSDPSEEEIRAMSREEANNFTGFRVGRQGCGTVTFDGPVDLKSILPLNEKFGGVIDIAVRSVSIYPDSSTKPPRGKGLNVPSTISIENSWPRNKGKPEGLNSGPLFEKHIRRLKVMPNTEFIKYDVETGVWVFKVPHYTRYGLDYDDEDEDDFGMSQLSAPPSSIKAPEQSIMEIDSDHTSAFGEDDTFHGKQMLTVPGGFGRQSAIDVAEESIVQTIEHDSPRSEHSAYSENDMSEDEAMDMAGAFPAHAEVDSPPKLMPGTPGRPLLDIDFDGDWAEQLQRTISPRKQNRDALREAQSKAILDREFSPMKPGANDKKSFKTSIDVMHALFDKRGGKSDDIGLEV